MTDRTHTPAGGEFEAWESAGRAREDRFPCALRRRAKREPAIGSGHATFATRTGFRRAVGTNAVSYPGSRWRRHPDRAGSFPAPDRGGTTASFREPAYRFDQELPLLPIR